MTRRWLVAAMATLFWLAACGGDARPSAEPPLVSADNTTITTAAPTATEADEVGTGSSDRSETHRRTEPELPEVVLVSAGAEPRRELRLHLSEGPSPGFTIEMTQAQRFLIDGADAGQAQMTFAFDIGTTILSVADGLAEVEMTYDAVRLLDGGSLTPAEATQAEARLADLVGLSFVSTVNDQGATIAMEVPRTFATLIPEIAQMLDEFEAPTPPLPTEAVGVGARWTVTSALTVFADAAMPSVTEYELVELHDDYFVVSMRGLVTVEPSTMTQDGTRLEFLGGETTNSGTMTWRFDSLQPFGETKSQGSIQMTESNVIQSVDVEVFVRAQVIVKAQG